MKQPTTIDFETEAIQPRPDYPPKPVGVAIWTPGQEPEYEAWGHPTDNGLFQLNGSGVKCVEYADKARATKKLQAAVKRGPVLCFNAKFDLDVGETHLGIPVPDWGHVHDPMFRLFLKDPHAKELSLKPSAERWLGLPPDERDEVRDWLVTHGVIARNENPGPYISKAPGSLVAKYAIGDVVRAKKLHDLDKLGLDKREAEAYDRERQLLPILLENERGGMRVDIDLMEQERKTYGAAFDKCEDLIRKALKAPGLNLDDDKAVGERLFKTKIVTNWTWTKGGNGRAPQRSVSKANLTLDKYDDKKIGLLLMYRNKLQVVLQHNLEPWLEQATKCDGRVYTEWNQVRQSHGSSGLKGARSGRITCSRWLNVTKSYDGKEDRYEHPGAGLPPLPLPRKYLLPDSGETWVHLDYRQQEFRIAAHYAEGESMAAYLADPLMDFHERTRLEVQRFTPVVYDKRTIKAVNFGIMFGEGIDLLSRKLQMSHDKTAKLRLIVKKAMPDIMRLEALLKRRWLDGEGNRTWGGRLYYLPPPVIAKSGPRSGQEVTLEYQALNYMCQPSAADITKEAIIRYHDKWRKNGRMLVTVYDEINISVPKKAVKEETERLRKAMESVELDVPMLTDAKTGPNWGELEKIK